MFQKNLYKIVSDIMIGLTQMIFSSNFRILNVSVAEFQNVVVNNVTVMNDVVHVNVIIVKRGTNHSLTGPEIHLNVEIVVCFKFI